MKQYLECLQHVLDYGQHRSDRTGVGTIGIFGYQMRFDLQKGYPLVTTKRVPFKSVISELIWFNEGSTNERRLAEILFGKHRNELSSKRTIWTDNAENQGVALGYTDGELGPVYGAQWRKWKDEHGNSIDQLQELIEGIKKNPFSRRHILSAWNVGAIDEMALPPCHCLAQFYVSSDMKLSCQLYQRSADLFLGVPFNIASYAAFTMMIAQVCGLKVGEFIWTGGDIHIYENHIEQVNEQLSRTPADIPVLTIDQNIMNIDEFKMDHFTLKDYNPQSTIKAQMAV